jgi:hypothetical protein
MTGRKYNYRCAGVGKTSVITVSIRRLEEEECISEYYFGTSC